MMEFVGDIFTAKDWIFGFGFAVALLVGFLFTYVLRIPGLLYTVVWTVIVLVTIMFLFVGSFMYDTYGKWNDAQSRPPSPSLALSECTCGSAGATWD